MTRKNRQFWADNEFVRRLEQIKAKRILNGKKDESLTKLTAEMIKSKKFEELEEDMVNRQIFGLRYER